MKRSLKLSKSTDSLGSKKGKVAGVDLDRRHRFRSFNDRIEEVDISSIQKIGGYRGSGPSSSDTTWFELSLVAWQEMNCSAAFAKFSQKIRPLTGTLATVLFNREAILEAIRSLLLEAAANPEGPARLALVPVFSLTAMLAKDLGSEFAPFFVEYFALLAPILPSAADADVIEAAFASLLYIFKCLLPKMLADLPNTFEAILKPLYLSVGEGESKQDAYLRKFASQSCGYLLRKSTQISSTGLFEYIEKSSTEYSWIPDFVAEALNTAIFDESSGKLRNCLKPLYLECFGYLRTLSIDSIWTSILRFTTVKLLQNTDPSSKAPLWRIFVQVLTEEEQVTFLVPILIDSFAFRFGGRVQLHREFLSEAVKFQSVECLACLLRSLTLELTLQNRPLVMKACEAVCAGESSRFLELLRFLKAFEWSHFDLVLKDQFLRVLTAAEDEMFVSLLEIVLEWQGTSTALNKQVNRLASISQQSTRALKLLVSHFITLVPGELKSSMAVELKTMLESKTFDRTRLQIASLIQPAVSVDFACLKSFIDNPSVPEQFDACRVALAGVSLSEEERLALAKYFVVALRSHSQEWRLAALNLLVVLLPDAQSQAIIEIFLSIERIPVDLATYRDKLVQLRRLEPLDVLKTPVSWLGSLVINYLFGFLQVKLTLLFPEGNRILTRFATLYSQEFSQISVQIFQWLSQESNSKTIVSAEAEQADQEVADESLLNLNKIRAQVKAATIEETFERIRMFENSAIFSALMRFMTANPGVCLPSKSAFLQDALIPAVLDAFVGTSSLSSLTTLLQANLTSLLKAFADARVVDSRLDAVLMQFLAHGDAGIQSRALECIFVCPRLSVSITSAWKDRLCSLLDEKHFRDEITALTTESGALHAIPNWMNSVAPLLVKILFGRLISRKGSTSSRNSLPIRRRMIMNCFGSWDELSLTVIVDFLLEPFRSGMAGVPEAKKLGFLNLCEDVIDSLGRKLDSASITRLIETIFVVIESEKEESVGDEESKRVKQVGMKRVAQLFKLFEGEAFDRFEGFLERLFDGLLNPRIQQLASHFTNATSSALVDIIVCLGQLSSGALLLTLVKYSPALWCAAIEAFGKESTKIPVVAQLTGFFEGALASSRRKDTEFAELEQVVVLPHLNVLLDAFDAKLAVKQVVADALLTGRIVAVIQGLSASVSDAQLAARLLSTLGRLLNLRTVNETVKTSILLSAAPLSRLCGVVDSQFFSLAAVQFSCLEGKPARQALVNLFSLFAELDSQHFELPTKLLVELHAWIDGRVAEPDFDRRLAAFAALKRAVDGGELPIDGFCLPVVYCMIYCLRDADELSIRNQSYAVLKSIVRGIQNSKTIELVEEPIENESSADDEIEEAEENLEEAEVSIVEVSTAKDPVQFIVLDVLLPAIKKSIKSANEVIRNEFISLLDLLVASFSKIQPFSALHAFNGGSLEDPEESIFYNLTHIQESRRCRAIRRIGELASAGALTGLTKRTIEDLLLPLTLVTALPNSPEAVVSEAMQNDSILSSGQVLARLPWGSFARRILDMTRELSAERKQGCWKKAALRLLPAMISNFRVSSELIEWTAFSMRVHENMIPAMFTLLHQSNAGASDKDALKYSIRVPIAVSIGHLIKLVSRGDLTVPSVQIHLPRLFAALLNILKVKELPARQVARDALVKIVGFLGAPFLPFLLKEGRLMLTRGYQRHVLVYTCHAILVELLRITRKSEAANAMIQENEAAVEISLNASAKLLVELALASCFGAQAKEREATEWTGKQPEVRAANGPEIIALTARFVDPRVLHEAVLEPIVQLARLQLERVELHAKTGEGSDDLIEKVEAAAFDSILRALFGQNGLQSIISGDSKRIPSVLAALHEMLQLEAGRGTGTHIHLLHTHALTLLSFVLNCRGVQEYLNLMDSFVSLTFDFLTCNIENQTRHSASINAAIGLFIQFVTTRDRFPSLSTLDMQKLLEEMFVSIIKSHSTAPAAYRLTATLIREWPELTITDSQLKVLLEFARVNLDASQGQKLTFSLIRSLLSKGIVLLQLFELMRAVRTAMITSHSHSTRLQCRSVFVLHLLHTPMATKRLEEELDFCLANLRYEFPAGRASVAALMESLASKLPLELVDRVAEAWFVALAAQLAKEMTSSEGAEEARLAICGALNALIARLPEGKRRDNLTLLLTKWILSAGKAAVQLAAWKICALNSKRFLTEQVLDRGLEILETQDEVPILLLIAVIEALTVAELSGEEARKVALVASQSQFFKLETDLQIRHRISLLWNCLLKRENN